MPRIGRPGLPAAQKSELWTRWEDGESLSDIGRASDKHAASVFTVVVAKGGIASAIRHRRLGTLTKSEREELSRGLCAGYSQHRIASDLGRSASTVSQEVRRNGGRRNTGAIKVKDRALQSALRPKPCFLSMHRVVQAIVTEKSQEQWSPQQIAGWLKITFDRDETIQRSHETIYKSLFIQASGVLKKELRAGPSTQRSGYAAGQNGQHSGADPWPDYRCCVDPRQACRD